MAKFLITPTTQNQITVTARLGGNAVDFPPHHVQKTFISGWRHNLYFSMMADMPGRRLSTGVTGFAFTSNVLRSNCPVVFVAFQAA